MIVILYDDDDQQGSVEPIGVFTDLFKARDWYQSNPLPRQDRHGWPGHYEVWTLPINGGQALFLCSIWS